MPASRYVDDYDDDGLDSDYDAGEYGEEGGLSPEDEAAMANGTAEVRKALGKDASKVTLQQIQEALWHYYYDVPKSVAYLNKTFITPAPAPTKTTPKPPAPKKTAAGTFSTFSFSAVHSPVVGTHGADHQCFSNDAERSFDSGWLDFSASDTSHRSFFDDMPWLNTPQDRQTVFVEPWRPRGGLLGGGEGTTGMSKLQKLAAARKKKNEQAKSQDKTGQAVEGIRKLAISESTDQKPLPLAKRQKISSSSGTPLQQRPDSQEETGEAKQENEPTVTPSPGEESGQTAEVAPVRAAPSAFARTLFGSAPASKATRRDVFPMPYTSSSSFSAKIFSEPSPDDIVLAAQSKGSNFARAK